MQIRTIATVFAREFVLKAGFGAILYAFLFALLPTHIASAQPTVAADLTIGVARASSRAEYQDNGEGASVDLFITRSRSTPNASPLVFGIGASFEAADATDLSCALSASGQCLQPYPSTMALAALAGLQTPRSWLRVFAGPAVAHVEQVTLGLAGRVDVALPVTLKLAITANVRGMHFPSVRSERYHVVSFGFGLRFQQQRE